MGHRVTQQFAESTSITGLGFSGCDHHLKPEPMALISLWMMKFGAPFRMTGDEPDGNHCGNPAADPVNHKQEVSGSRQVKKSGTQDQDDHHRIGEMCCSDQNTCLF